MGVYRLRLYNILKEDYQSRKMRRTCGDGLINFNARVRGICLYGREFDNMAQGSSIWSILALVVTKNFRFLPVSYRKRKEAEIFSSFSQPAAIVLDTHCIQRPFPNHGSEKVQGTFLITFPYQPLFHTIPKVILGTTLLWLLKLVVLTTLISNGWYHCFVVINSLNPLLEFLFF